MRTGESRKGEEERAEVEVERLTRHVLPDKTGECPCRYLFACI